MSREATPDDVLAGEAQWCVVEGDATAVLATIPGDSVHVCYTDPPYGLSDHGADDVLRCLQAWLAGQVYTHGGRGFMGKDWDAFVPGPEVWREVYRVLKPGAHCVAFSSTRTVDLLGIAMRIAGGEMRDGWAWLQGQGFPKNLDVSKAIDRSAGAERTVVGYDASRARPNRMYASGAISNIGGGETVVDRSDNGATITAPTSAAAKLWDGHGTTTKPAYEPLVVTRRPLKGTVASNVLAHGCGTLNIDGARIGTSKQVPGSGRKETRLDGWGMNGDELTDGFDPNVGRYPANLALVHDEGCELVGHATVKTGMATFKNTETGAEIGSYSGGLRRQEHGEYGFADQNGTEVVDEWRCTETCAVAELARQSGVSESKSGKPRKATDPSRVGFGMTATGQKHDGACSAARFFYQGKAANSDRLAYLSCVEGCSRHGSVCGAESTRKAVREANKALPPEKRERAFPCPQCGQRATVYEHPTVKPYDLAAYHARLLSLPAHVRPVAIVPFCGTGVEARALLDVGFHVIAIDIDPRHVAMTKHRLRQENSATQKSAKNPAAPTAESQPGNAAASDPVMPSLDESVEKETRAVARSLPSHPTIAAQLMLFGGDQ